MYLLTKTPFGRMCNAVRDNQQRAEFIGYDVRKIRWMAFSLSAMFAGAAGSLHAINYEHIGFESVSLVQSGMVLFMAYIGGIRKLSWAHNRSYLFNLFRYYAIRYYRSMGFILWNNFCFSNSFCSSRYSRIDINA